MQICALFLLSFFISAQRSTVETTQSQTGQTGDVTRENEISEGKMLSSEAGEKPGEMTHRNENNNN